LGPGPSRAAARLARVVERALAEPELSLAQYRLLAFLAEGASAAAVIADKLAVSRPSITALVDGLVSRGLVARSGDPSDRRRVHVALTDAGRKALALADEAVTRRLAALLEPLPATTARKAVTGLEALREALDIDRAGRLRRR
ncbi:MAG TPA: MarR family transcriptional regulator, partial [Egibacteraceae bacterium]|nr:MarR family transcriptional regulator [Egibacteraceae bacterium]